MADAGPRRSGRATDSSATTHAREDARVEAEAAAEAARADVRAQRKRKVDADAAEVVDALTAGAPAVKKAKKSAPAPPAGVNAPTAAKATQKAPAAAPAPAPVGAAHVKMGKRLRSVWNSTLCIRKNLKPVFGLTRKHVEGLEQFPHEVTRIVKGRWGPHPKKFTVKAYKTSELRALAYKTHGSEEAVAALQVKYAGKAARRK